MKLGEFIENFSHNNVIRLLYKDKGGHRVVLNDWNDVSMDWEINESKGKFRHYVNNEVLGLATVSFRAGEGIHHSEAINIVIEELEDQPIVDEEFENVTEALCEKLAEEKHENYFKYFIKQIGKFKTPEYTILPKS